MEFSFEGAESLVEKGTELVHEDFVAVELVAHLVEDHVNEFVEEGVLDHVGVASPASSAGLDGDGVGAVHGGPNSVVTLDEARFGGDGDGLPVEMELFR
jgi:hypothetical protein